MTARTLFLSALLSTLCGTLGAQQAADPHSFGQVIDGLFRLQQSYFPQEKAYVQLDRKHYMSGDTIWMRGYLADGATHRPDFQSRYFYVDLIDPADSLFLRAKLPHLDGTYTGYLPLPENTREGDYTLRAYSLFMRNAGEEYYFETPVRISNPQSIRTPVEVNFIPENRRMVAEFTFSNASGNSEPLAAEISLALDHLRAVTFPSDPNGRFTAAFELPDSGRRHVLKLDYAESKRFVELPPPEDIFTVTFHPEGGYLLAGTPCRVGFKALNARGLSEAVTGRITDETGGTVAEFSSAYKGMGSFYMLPEAGKTYAVECTDSRGHTRRFELPAVQQQAFALRVSRRNGNTVITAGRPAGFEPNTPLYLVIHTRGVLLYADALSAQSLTIADASLPAGVSSILLLDGARNVLSERLIYRDNGSGTARTTLATDKSRYASRDKVSGTVTLTDEKGVPLKGLFSLSVTDDRDVLPDSTENILTHLLLTSELKGHIESSAWYFSGADGAEAALDNLLLTQGWTRYDIPALMQGKVSQTDPALDSDAVTGRVKGILSERPIRQAQVLLIGSGFLEQTATDNEGRFAFGDLLMPDTSRVLLQAITPRGGDRIELLIDRPYTPTLPGIVPPYREEGEMPSRPLYEFALKSQERWTIENGMRITHLDAAVARAPSNSNSYARYIHTLYDENFFLREKVETFEDYLWKMDELNQIEYDGLSIRFLHATIDSAALFVIDDFVMDTTFDWRGELLMHPFHDIRSVGLISQNFASALASVPVGGGFFIDTYSGWGNRPPNKSYNRKVYQPLGFQAPVEFYAPLYETTVRRLSPTRDLRTTIYWNPALTTDANGRATFDFYTSDPVTTYSVVIEGLTDEGRIVRAVEKIERR